MSAFVGAPEVLAPPEAAQDRVALGHRAATRVLARLVAGVLLLLVVSLGTFVLLYSIGDPARAVAGENASAAQLRAVRAQFGFDRSVLTQYADWLAHAVRGDFGTAFQSGQRPVTSLVMERLPTTFGLAAGAVVLSVLVSVACGYVIGMRPNRLADQTVTRLANLGAAIPPFFLGSLLALLLAVDLRLFPPAGYAPLHDGLRSWLSYMVLPWITLSLGLLGQQVRTLRASLLKELRADYVRTARMKGLSESVILQRHVARNSVLPFLTVIGLQTPRLITSALFVEAVFAVPGIGSLLVNAVQAQDLPIVQALVVLVSAAMVVANILVDISYERLNPLARASTDRIA